jgi:hypothetical protein
MQKTKKAPGKSVWSLGQHGPLGIDRENMTLVYQLVSTNYTLTVLQRLHNEKSHYFSGFLASNQPFVEATRQNSNQ